MVVVQVMTTMNRQPPARQMMMAGQAMTRCKIGPNNWRGWRISILQFGEILVLVLMNLQCREKLGIIVLGGKAEA